MIQIRQCRTEDFDAVVALLRQLWPDKHISADSLRLVYDRALASGSQTYLCATNGSGIIGFGSLSLKNNMWQEGYLGHIDELVVDAGYRSRGIGTQLLEHLILLAREKGCRRIELDSAFHRRAAHDFYTQHGFESRALLFSRVL